MTADPLFDKSIFRILVAELSADDVAELLDVFLADTSDKIDALVANDGDRPGTKREVHAIKSSAATFGFAELSGLARELERGLDAMSDAQLEQSVAALRRSFDATSRFARDQIMTTSLETI
jgi:HPt (histidine-containing phosphotransfer) domain-containing protein